VGRAAALAAAVAAAAAVVVGTAWPAAKPKPRFVLQASGFAAATYVTSAPGDPATLYVVEQRGTIRIVRGARIAGTFLDLRDAVSSDGERGLLSVAFHPRYAQNHLFYVDYTDRNGDTHVSEFSSANGIAVRSSERQLLFVEQPYANHNGGQLQFDRAGRLYVGMGDGGTSANVSHGDPEYRAQDPQSRLGKLLRIDPTRESEWQLVGLGLRNPWRFSFDRRTGDLWLADVGTSYYEEVDFRAAAAIGSPANFGWSRFEGSYVYNAAAPLSTLGARVAPIYEYRSGFGNRCGVIGGYVYRGRKVPWLAGRYVFGDLCTGEILSLRRDARGRAVGVAALAARLPSLTSFGEDGNGELYAVAQRGGLYRLR
jgi:glucose/arabinose dehydrogenase